ncbi:cytidylate kinase [Streptococcus pneumoniae]|nr:cytidylate kinase [Streptococcus pneumoniae]
MNNSIRKVKLISRNILAAIAYYSKLNKLCSLLFIEYQKKNLGINPKLSSEVGT